MLTAEDLRVINAQLQKGNDVRIQQTRDGYRIIADTVKIVKQVESKK